jgi:uncharacterized membrane protein YidH (DUF202 family)
VSSGDAAHDGEAAEESLQSERTYLAWQRTGLSFAAIAVLLLHVAGRSWQGADALGLFGAVAAVTMLLSTTWRYRRSPGPARGEPGAADPRMIAAVSTAATVLCVGGLVLLFCRP